MWFTNKLGFKSHYVILTTAESLLFVVMGLFLLLAFSCAGSGLVTSMTAFLLMASFTFLPLYKCYLKKKVLLSTRKGLHRRYFGVCKNDSELFVVYEIIEIIERLQGKAKIQVWREAASEEEANIFLKEVMRQADWDGYFPEPLTLAPTMEDVCSSAPQMEEV